MFLFSGGILYSLIEIFVAFSICVIAYYKWSFTYWKRKGLEVPFPPSIPAGNIGDLLTQKSFIGDTFRDVYNKLRAKGVKHGGMYMLATPVYIPTDPEIIKHIILKDFSHFVNHGVYYNEKSDPLSVHLFSIEDQAWKDWRVKLTPTFTSGKIKMMSETMINTTPALASLMDQYAATREPLNIKELFGRFTTDIIGSCAFGIECNSLKDPNAEFRKHGRIAFEEIDIVENIKIAAQFFIPHAILRYFNFKMTKNEVEKFFIGIVKETVNYREQNNIYRKDFMHLLLQLKNQGKVTDDATIKNGGKSQDYMSLNELAAQCFLFFIAGFETSSTTSTFALYELARNQDIQDKLREEINGVLEKHEGRMSYEAFAEMSYLEKVIHESLRKYPPVPILPRKCTKDYRIPGTDVTIRKGTVVQIPVLGIHRDPEYYPEPDKFDPDRFTDENKQKRPQFTWLPFGEGPRICIGARFGMLQSKVGIATLLRNHRITVNKKTQEPIKLRTQGLATSAHGGIWLDVERLSC